MPVSLPFVIEAFGGVCTIFINCYESSIAQFFNSDKRGQLEQDLIYPDW